MCSSLIRFLHEAYATVQMSIVKDNKIYFDEPQEGYTWALDFR